MRTFKEKACKHCGSNYIPTGSSSHFCSLDCRRLFYISSGKSKEWRDKFNLKAGVQVGVGSGGLTKFWTENINYKTGAEAFRNHGRRLKESGGQCNRCGKNLKDAKRGEWCSHHRDHDRTNNVADNLELLCKRCHQLHHEAGKFLLGFNKVQRLSRQGVDDTNIEAPSIQMVDDIV